MKKFFLAVLLPFLPAVALAQYQVQSGFIDSVLTLLSRIVNDAFPFLIAILVIVFIFELVKYVRATPDKKETDRKGLLYSILALFIGMSLFGIIALLQNITGTGNQGYQSTYAPTVPVNF